MENSIFVVMETAGGAIKNVGLEMLSPAKEIAAAKGLKIAARSDIGIRGCFVDVGWGKLMMSS